MGLPTLYGIAPRGDMQAFLGRFWAWSFVHWGTNMPSSIIGTLSGGAQLCSGDPFSGRLRVTGVTLLVPTTSGPQFSGGMYFGRREGYASGGVTIQSGGGQASGGMADGLELVRGTLYNFRIGDGGLEDVLLAVPAAASGSRVFWEPYGGPYVR